MRVDGNPEEESHRRCVRARVNDSETESREPAEETEDLSRRQFGLTDLILLSRTLLLRPFAFVALSALSSRFLSKRIESSRAAWRQPDFFYSESFSRDRKKDISLYFTLRIRLIFRRQFLRAENFRNSSLKARSCENLKAVVARHVFLERRGKTLWILSARACHECSRAVACGCGRLEKCMPLRWHLQTLERLSASHATPSPLVTSRRFILFFFLFHALIESNRIHAFFFHETSLFVFGRKKNELAQKSKPNKSKGCDS